MHGAASTNECVLCGAGTRTRFEKNGWRIARCGACGHEQVGGPLPADHTATVYGDDYFTAGGDGYDDYLAEAELLRQHGRRYAKLMAAHRPPGRLLDIGAAAGFVLSGFVEAGWQGVGVEPNAAMAAHGRERLGLDVRQGDLESVELADGSFDLVTFIQVAPHLRDLHRAMANAAAVTAPGGYWLIETWNRASLPARLLGKQWHEYSPPSVLHWFDPGGVARLGEAHGMRRVASGRPAKHIAAGHAKSLLRAKAHESVFARVMSAAASVLPDRAVLPYPALDLFWMLLQKPG